jgi:hypothetical protein
MVDPKIDFDALPWEKAALGARFKSFRDGARLMRIVEFTQEFIEPYWCEKGHIGFVIAGELELDFHGTLVRYPAGSGIMISAGPANGHKARAVTQTVRLFLVEDV